MSVTSTDLRKANGWSGGYAEWFDGNTAFISVVFSWLLEKALSRAAELAGQGFTVRIGGPAARLAGVDNGEFPNAVAHHNTGATRTTTGCVFGCDFCAVPKIEGKFVELPITDAPKSILYDNNFTASSRMHFDRVIDWLKPVKNVDFNQEISAILLTDYQASRLAELDMKCVRLAWDSVEYESKFMSGYEKLRRAGFPKSKISVYVLVGFNDTPADALYRVQTVKSLGSMPFPMRYQPLDTTKRNSYVGEHWTHHELVRFCRYWANLRITAKIPFDEFQYPSVSK